MLTQYLKDRYGILIFHCTKIGVKEIFLWRFLLFSSGFTYNTIVNIRYFWGAEVFSFAFQAAEFENASTGQDGGQARPSKRQIRSRGIERSDYPDVDLLSHCPFWMNQDIPLEDGDIQLIRDDRALADEIKSLEAADMAPLNI